MNIVELSNEQIYQRYMYSYPHKTAYRKFEEKQITLFKEELERDPLSLYVHIPFCSSKCGYCNLLSYVGKDDTMTRKYIEAVCEQARELASMMELKIKSLIIGGGTPLILEESLLEKLFHTIEECFHIDYKAIVSCIETSPKETTRSKLAFLNRHKLNRISIGAQSFLDTELQALKRQHKREDIMNALDLIREFEFDVLNIDVIYGIYGQTKQTLLHSIKEALRYQPEELFLYPLYIRENKKLSHTTENMYLLYLAAKDYLLENGYVQKSMRRFAKNDHKTETCGFETMLSLGAGGRSYIGNVHTCLPYTDRQNRIRCVIEEYIHTHSKNTFDFGFVLNEDEQKRRFIIKNLLVAEGLSLRDYTEMFHTDAAEEFPQFDYLYHHQLCENKSERIILNENGLALSDMIGPMFISDEVETLMKDWVDELVF